ncbi:MAG: methionyl-tRNA formyltransferase [Thermomicrobiales bacterium]
MIAGITPSASDVATLPWRVVFLGTPAFALPPLQALHRSPLTEVVLVVTQPDRPAGRGRRLAPSAVKEFALSAQLPLFTPERLRGEAVITRLREANADLFVIAAYGQLLRPAVLAMPRFGCLNVHPSLLPRHLGPAPVAAAILAGDEETGVTIMLTDAGMDTGPVLAQRRLPLPPDATTASLTPALFEAGADLLLETIPPWVSGAITPRPQDEQQVTVSRLFTQDDGWLDWTLPASVLERRVRALNPWPRTATTGPMGRLLVLAARARAGEDDTLPGTVQRGEHDEFLVTTGAGSLQLELVQAEGRKPVAGAVYLAAHPALAGARLSLPPQKAQEL